MSEKLKVSPTIKEAYENVQWLKEQGADITLNLNAIIAIHGALVNSCGFQCKKETAE